MNDMEGLQSVPGRRCSADLTHEGMHVSTFVAGLAVVFGLSLLLPVVPWAVALVAALGTVWGMGRTVKPGWRRVPFTRWRLAFSPLDGMLWTATMSMLLFLALGVALGGRP